MLLHRTAGIADRGAEEQAHMPHAHPRVNAAPITSEFADDPDMAELVGLFISELPQRVGAILGALTAGDMAMLRRLAHQLKGAGAGYGFPLISERAAEVERRLLCGPNAAPSDLDAVRGQVKELVDLCRRACAARRHGT
jgi:HPt (histidine-containing phosphotransfer) domain-containing protein